MSQLICNEVLEQGAGETVTHAVDFTNWLRKPLSWVPGQAAAATLSTLTSILEVTTTDLTLSSKTILASATVPRDRPDTEILAAHGVSFKVSGGDAGEKYAIKIIVIDSDSNTWECYVRLQITPAVTA